MCDPYLSFNFAAMGKIIKIGVLYVTFSLLVMKSPPLLAQSETKSVNDTIRALEELVINAERPTLFQPLVHVVAPKRAAIFIPCMQPTTSSTKHQHT